MKTEEIRKNIIENEVKEIVDYALKNYTFSKNNISFGRQLEYYITSRLTVKNVDLWIKSRSDNMYNLQGPTLEVHITSKEMDIDMIVTIDIDMREMSLL